MTETENSDRFSDLIKSWNGLDNVYSLIDQAQTELEQAALGSVCAPNCGKCCSVPVVTGVEVDYIVSTLGSLPGFGKRVSEALNWLEHGHASLDGKQTLEGQIRLVKDMRCPFLSYDRTCQIYEARPLACRMYGVMAPADDYCEGSKRIAKRSTPGYIIAQGTPIYRAVVDGMRAVLNFAKQKVPEQTLMGFLPTMIARQMGTSQYNFLVNHDMVQPAKLAIGERLLTALEPVRENEELREKAVSERQTGLLAGEYDALASKK